MRSYARRNQDYRGKISIHPHDDAAHAHRLSKTRIEVHPNDRRRKTTGCHGFVAQARVRSAGFSCVSDLWGIVRSVGRCQTNTASPHKLRSSKGLLDPPPADLSPAYRILPPA